MPPSSLYCCQRSLSMSSIAARNRRMAASPGVRLLLSSAEAGKPLVSAKAGTPLASIAAPATVRPVAAAPFRTERRDRRAPLEAGRLGVAGSLDMSSIVVATLLISLSARELVSSWLSVPGGTTLRTVVSLQQLIRQLSRVRPML